MNSTNPLSVVGLMLTLSSLLGSFFYLQLSQWVRDILALRSKCELNRYAGVTEEKKAMRECAVEIDKLLNWPTYVVNSTVVVFVVIMTSIAFGILERAAADPLYPPLWNAFALFLAVFLLLSAGLLLHGTMQARAVRLVIEEPRKDGKLNL